MAAVWFLCVMLVFLGECCSMKIAEPNWKEKSLHKSLNGFAIKLHNAMLKVRSKGNLFYSPYSIATTLAMISAGTEGQTKEEIAKAIGWNNSTNNIHETFGKLMKRLTAKGARYSSLNIANKIWVEKGTRLQDKYREILLENYASKVGKNDFKNDADYSRRKINEWVKMKTGNKIKDFLKRGTIDSATRLVLTNAMYFKAIWKTPFIEGMTRKRKFYTTADKYFKIKMMEARLMTRMASNENFTILELPYKGKKFSMMTVLPEEGKSLEDIESSLYISKLLEMKYTKIRTKVLFPKFKITSTNDLTRSLSALKIRSLFGPGCDLSAMFRKPDGIFVTKAVHKAFIEVDEKGTRAGAATAFITGRTFLPIYNFNRPFLFFIKDNVSNLVLFFGRFTHPE